eukprot:EG_transcript_22404
MHGLESGPTGSKALYLRARYAAVETPDMAMGVYRLDQRNSFLRGYLRAALTAWPSQWGSAAVTHSLDGCLAVQREAIARFQPDVVVGSSWGGAIGLLAFASGAWQGPTLLLAPALTLAIRKLGEPLKPEYSWSAVCEAVKASPHSHNLLVVHGDADDTVPHQDSVEFAARTGVELRTITGGDHRLNDALLTTDELLVLIDDVVQRSKRTPSP